jgi:SAM-dependent methyltransferase
VTLLQFDARAIPAREEFDVVGAFDVIEHIPEDETVLRAMRTCLRPGGGAIVTVPQHPWLWSPFDDAAHHCRRYRRGELEAKLRTAGFDVLRSTSYNALLLPLMLASRWSKKLGVRRRDAALSEFNIARWLNRTLSLALTAETWMTTHGVDWPLGGTRVVVARRSPDQP